MMNGIPTIVKWAGGKKQLLAKFESFFPKKKINRYYDPFVGGGAVALYVIKRLKPKEVYLSDINEELINCYKMIQEDVEGLIVLLKEYKQLHSEKFYYEMRKKDPKILSRLQRAGRFIYLNKTCFNGLYRVNSKGEFNVPMGTYKNPAICQEADLREAHDLLKNAVVEVKQFDKAVETAKKGDFVYFDPPYYPLKKDSFTTYTKESFLEKEQEKLAKVFKELAKEHVDTMLSNSDTEFIRALYKGYLTETVDATRMINCNAEGRGKIKEVVVTSPTLSEKIAELASASK